MDENYVQEVENAIENKKLSQIDGPLLAMGAMNFFVNSATSIIVPFFPNQATQCGVNTFWIGLIFAILPLGSVAAGLPIGKYMLILGRQRIMFVGLVVNCISILTLAFVALITNNPSLFIAISLVSRLLQGASRSAYSTVVFSYVPIMWPDSVQRHVGILESLTGLGVMLGPIIGGIFSDLGKDAYPHNASLGQYQMPFFILGALFALWIIPTIMILPPDLKENQVRETLPLGKIMAQKNVAMTCLAAMISCGGSTFINPLYDNYMTVYGLSQSNISYIYGFLALSYVLTLSILPIFEKQLIYKFTLSLGLVVGIISNILYAPIGDIPWKWWSVIIGLFINGISQGMTILPQIPELKMLIIQNQFTEDDVKAGDMASGIFFSAYSSGIFLGPFLAGAFQTPILNHFNSLYPSAPCIQAANVSLACPCSVPTPVGFNYESGQCCYSWQIAFGTVSRYFAVLQLLGFLIYGFVGEAFKRGWIPMGQMIFGKGKDNEVVLQHSNFLAYTRDQQNERSVLKVSILNQRSQMGKSTISRPSVNVEPQKSRANPQFVDNNTSLQPLIKN